MITISNTVTCTKVHQAMYTTVHCVGENVEKVGIGDAASILSWYVFCVYNQV